jgi:serine protease
MFYVERDRRPALPLPSDLPVRPPLLRATALAALAAGVALGVPAAASAAPRLAYVPGEVVVRYAPGVDRAARAATQRATGTGSPEAFAPRSRTLKIHGDATVAEAVRALRRRPGVLSANPNYIARAAGFMPSDPGAAGIPGGWAQLQWNFLAGTGVNAPDAWENLIHAGRPGGDGVTVAVLDTGVAYADRGRFRRSPDLTRTKLRKGYDFVSSDPYPNDENGHGTHVASTIFENVDNGVGLTGLAYGARLMPVRVLDRAGDGDSAAIARGIRYAARKGAQVINLSFEFERDVTGSAIPDVIGALHYARRKGVLVVGAAGNTSAQAVAYPARSPLVLSVGAVTERGCQARYSNTGPGLDVVAPGGGKDAVVPGDPRCRPQDRPGRAIYQLTFAGSVRRFGLPGGYVGTSMAAPHVSGIAALVIASRVLGRAPTPGAIRLRLRRTATDLGVEGYDSRYGAGLVDAARATTAG